MSHEPVFFMASSYNQSAITIARVMNRGWKKAHTSNSSSSNASGLGSTGSNPDVGEDDGVVVELRLSVVMVVVVESMPRSMSED